MAMVTQTPALHQSGVHPRGTERHCGQVQEDEGRPVPLTRELAMGGIAVVLHEGTRHPSTGSGCHLSPALAQSHSFPQFP